MSEPGAPPQTVREALASRPPPGEPVAWWRIHGEHCDVRVGVDRDGFLCDGDESARLWSQAVGTRAPHDLTRYIKQGGPVAVEQIVAPSRNPD
ncbi:MAG: hypothetical protein KC613_26870 [Myxococcales bacterium]|nr:hypothetical protein [Myxococcales bacterium]